MTWRLVEWLFYKDIKKKKKERKKMEVKRNELVMTHSTSR